MNDGSFSFLGEFSDIFFGKNGSKWTLQNKQLFKKFLYFVSLNNYLRYSAVSGFGRAAETALCMHLK